MRILLMNDYINEFGGAERYFLTLKRVLEQHGHAVTLFGADSSSKKGGGENISSYFSRWRSKRYYRQAYQLISEFKPDLIHAHGLSRIISPSPVLAAKQLNIPTVMTLHDNHLLCAKTWAVTKSGDCCPGFSLACLTSCQGSVTGFGSNAVYLLKYLKIKLHRSILQQQIDHFVAPSQAILQLAQVSLQLDPSRISHIPYGLEIEEQQPEGAALRQNFLYVGRLAKEKGVDCLVQALQLCPDRSLKLRIAGTGPEENNLKVLVEELNLQQQVIFLGKLSPQQLSSEYASAIALVVPSIWQETGPLVILEAMQYETPSIASARGGCLDFIENESSGLLFEPGNAQHLSRQMQRLADEPRLAEQFGQAAHAKLHSEYSFEQHYQKLLGSYQQVLKK